MNKHDFLKELLESLSALPEAEREKAYAFYAEIIDDSMEDGISEEEAVQRLGSMDEIVEQIVSEIPMSVLIKARMGRNKRGLLMPVLLILGFPVWFSVLAAAFSVALTAFAVVWIADLSLWAVFGSCAAAALAGCVGFAYYFPDIGAKLISLGIALAGAGCAIPAFMASLYVTRQFARLTNLLWRKIKNSLLKKRGIPQ
jgi:uncharacterized membrane protein